VGKKSIKRKRVIGKQMLLDIRESAGQGFEIYLGACQDCKQGCGGGFRWLVAEILSEAH
jgi:hypothetical protein